MWSKETWDSCIKWLLLQFFFLRRYSNKARSSLHMDLHIAQCFFFAFHVAVALWKTNKWHEKTGVGLSKIRCSSKSWHRGTGQPEWLPNLHEVRTYGETAVYSSNFKNIFVVFMFKCKNKTRKYARGFSKILARLAHLVFTSTLRCRYYHDLKLMQNQNYTVSQ